MDLGRSMFKDLSSLASTAKANVRGSTTKELLQQIEKQEQELLKYKKRTRDLVVSYKAIIEEKNKLQQTLETLTTSGNVQAAEADSDHQESEEEAPQKELLSAKSSTGTTRSRSPQKKYRKKLKLKPANVPLPGSDEEPTEIDYNNYEDCKTGDSAFSTDEDEDEANNQKLQNYKKQVRNLKQQNANSSKSLKALTIQLNEAMQNNNKLKETFLTDKKIMKNEYETKITKLNKEISAANENFKITEEQLTLVKDSLRNTTNDFEKEKDNFNKFRRESQKEVINYKKKLSELELKYDKEKKENVEMNKMKNREDNENLAKDELLDKYKSELDDYKDRLREAVEKLNTPDEKMVAKIKHLENELEYRKEDYGEKMKILNEGKSRLENRLKWFEEGKSVPFKCL